MDKKNNLFISLLAGLIAIGGFILLVVGVLAIVAIPTMLVAWAVWAVIAFIIGIKVSYWAIFGVLIVLWLIKVFLFNS